MLPLPAATVSDILRRLDGVKFSQIYGAFEGREILVNAKAIVHSSGETYLTCLARNGSAI